VKGNQVFKEWARSWARRTMIQSAARVINPRPIEEHQRVSFDSNHRTLVLEHYSEHECSLLLSCSRRDVIAGRNRALQQLRDAMELHLDQQLRVGSEKLGA